MFSNPLATPDYHNCYSNFPGEPTVTLQHLLLTLPWNFLENSRNFSFLGFNGIVSHFPKQVQIFSSSIIFFGHFFLALHFENIFNFRVLT